MLKYVDEVTEETEGFAYKNTEGGEDHVLFERDDEYLNLTDTFAPGSFLVSIADVPKLIKALKAAYQYKTGEVI